MAPLFVVSVLLMFNLQKVLGQTAVPSCKQLQPGASIPNINIGNDFKVKIEVVSQEIARVLDMTMYYSFSKQQIRLTMLDFGVRSDLYFYFADNEILKFDYSNGRGNCSVDQDLANSPDTFLVGGVNNKNIQVPLAVIHFIGSSGFGDDIQQHYVGTTSVRNMTVDSYNSCQKWTFGNLTTTVNVTHYFSNKQWSGPNPNTVPVMVEIHGSVYIHNEWFQINHYYNFFGFESSVDPVYFETPPGIFCQGRNNDLPFPTLPTYIKMSGEAVDQVKGHHVSYFEEIYDPEDNILVARSQSQKDIGTQGGMNHIVSVRDYVTGLAYTLDTFGHVCSVNNISAVLSLSFDYLTPQGKVREITPSMLFYANSTKYTYLGERTIRAIQTDTWVTKTVIPQFSNPVTLEWYFAKDDVTSWNDDSSFYQENKYRMPVLMRIWESDMDTNSVDTNIYHVDFTRIMFGAVDIRDCYPNRQSNYIKLVLEGIQMAVVSTNIDLFKWTAVFSISTTAKVRWIQIADLKIYYESNDVILEFELLDAPPYSNDVEGAASNWTSLSVASRNIQNAINQGSMIINVWESTSQSMSKPVIVSKSSQIPRFSQPDSGYSAGALAGLGVAMLFIGGAGGSIGAHFFIK